MLLLMSVVTIIHWLRDIIPGHEAGHRGRDQPRSVREVPKMAYSTGGAIEAAA